MAIRVIIDDGKPYPLGIAETYYKQFPLEPSPSGDLDLKDAQFVKVQRMSFDQLLVELGQTARGGTALIVCHAHDEHASASIGGGLLMPLAADATVSAQDGAFQLLIEASDAYREATAIRMLPEENDEDKKSKRERWIALATRFNRGDPRDNATLAEVEQFFESGFQRMARSELRFQGGATSLKRMLRHLDHVRALQLDRVEFRSCKIGNDKTALDNLKSLLGCRALLAPTAWTFYLNRMTVNNLDRFRTLYNAERRKGELRLPGSVGRMAQDPEGVEQVLSKTSPSSRIFLDIEPGYTPGLNPQPAPGKLDREDTANKLKVRVFVMMVEKLGPARYRGYAATWNEAAKRQPVWGEASEFVRDYIMEKTSYRKGDLMISGFWTPGEELPWLLPNEPAYKEHITQV